MSAALKGWKKWLLLALGVINLALTFSKGAWIAVILAGMAALGLKNRKWLEKNWKKLVLVAGVILVTAAALFFFNLDKLDLKQSDWEHIAYPLETLEEIVRHPWGHGLGVYGPSSAKVEQLNTVDNWYLTVAGNLGVLGLGIFLAIWWLILRGLWARGGMAEVAFCASVGILGQIVFLDTLVESGMFSLLMLLIALGLRKNFMLSSEKL